MSSEDEIETDNLDNELAIPLETIEDNTENENKNSDDENQSERKVVKPKRVVKNPQPKFNEQTLKTSKGLPAIAGHFKRVKFKGKGHEEQDLNVLMKTYEYWCHRLFPKYPFEASIARLETLGTKKATQTQLKILRAGLDLEEDKKLSSDEEDLPATDGFVDQFDQLLPTTQHVEVEIEMSEEQRERIQLNRIRAEALRKQRYERAKVSKDQNNSSENTQNDDSQFVGQMGNDENLIECTPETGHHMDVQDEVDFDSILNIINQNEPTPSRNTEVEKENVRTKKPRVFDINEEIVENNETNIVRGTFLTTNNDIEYCNQAKNFKKRQNIIDSDEDENNDRDRTQNHLRIHNGDHEISSEGSPLSGSKDKRNIRIFDDDEEGMN